MPLFFEVREGPNKGLKALATEGLQIGRASVCGLRLKDPKVSSIHAEVQKNEQGDLVLNDKGSSNLIKTAEGRVRTLVLKDHLDFKIGNTRFHVLDERDQTEIQESSKVELERSKVPAKFAPPTPAFHPSAALAPIAPSASPEAPQSSPARVETPSEKPEIAEKQNAPKKKSEVAEWRLGLAAYFKTSDLRTRRLSSEVRALIPAVEIEVIRGYQLGMVWTLGYGPREFGRACADLSIWDEKCPEVAFQISAHESGEPTLQALAGSEVKVNEREASSEKLCDGDLIAVGETVLRIRFL